MNVLSKSVLLVIALLTSSATVSAEQPRPGLILTKAGVEKIRAERGSLPLFDASVEAAKAEVDAEIELGIDTPIPRDFSGGYTHARHKQNFLIAQKAGVLFQILGDERYAIYVRDMLLQYAAMYPTLPLHPQQRSYARGKLFWQCLNDSNWLVYMSQAYDAIYDWLSAAERDTLETDLFRPFADFISIGNPQFFNRVHNHSTWGNAAVGMIGLVMDDDELIERALYGIPFDAIDIGAKDDDGGLIYSPDGKAGFLANLEEPFSPDGYYTEGPYYQRYAMYPFLIFAQGLNNLRPGLEILEHKDGVLLKSVYALLNLADADGEFFPLNDGQKGMSYDARELITAVDITYLLGCGDLRLLSIAERQGQVLLDDAGLAVALGARDGKARPFVKASVNLADGRDGDEGGVAVLRQGDEDLTLVFKYSAQGLSHGHYDKLSYSLYERGEEVVQDYGMARFVNIGQKGGGNYLPENSSWAKQTIAHNTVTIDETSHFGGDYETGSRHHSVLHFFDADDAAVQVVSARELNAYPGTGLLRMMAMIRDDRFAKPIVLDLIRVESGTKHQYDLPLYFLGQVIDTNVDYDTPSTLEALGRQNGYQHLFVEGTGNAPADDNTRFQWLGPQGFYTLTSATRTGDEWLFARIGANDPDFNLRRDATLILRRRDTADTTFASVLEPHGNYSAVSEFATNAESRIAKVEIVRDSDDYTAVSIASLDGSASLFIVANRDNDTDRRHRVRIGGETYRWAGPYFYQPAG